MTAIVARLRQLARYAWALLVPAGAWLAFTFFRRRQRLPQAIDLAIARSRQMRLEAEARAAVEIAAARAQNKAEQGELLKVLREADGGEDAQIERLIEVGRKIREGK
jgi:hypothetical protein